jgi:hypothetical protein
MFRSRLRILLPVLGLVIASAGCQGRPTFTCAPVEGTITKGGRPLAEVQVVFFGDPDAGTLGPRASGATDKDGRYRLQGDVIRGEPTPPDGAVVGKHRVCIIDLDVQADDVPAEADGTPPTISRVGKKRSKPSSRVPPSYGNVKETPLRAEVRPGPQTLDFDIR